MRTLRRILLLLFALVTLGLSSCALSYDFDDLTFGPDVEAADTTVSDGGGVDAGASDAGVTDTSDTAGADTDVGDVIETDTDSGGDVVETDTGTTDGGEPDACTPTGDEVCDGEDNDCDGLVDDADPDIVFSPDECGACGLVCTNTFSAEGACDVDECVVERCFDGYEDVDGVYENGCEYRLESAWTSAANLRGRALFPIDETTLLLQGNFGLALVSIEDATSPRQLDFFATDGIANSVGVSRDGTTIVVGDSLNNLVLLQVVDGTSFQVEARASISRTSTALGVSNDVALVGFSDGGVQLYDISGGRFRVTGQNRPWEGDSVVALYIDDDSEAGWIITEAGRVGAFDIVSGVSPIALVPGDGLPAELLEITSSIFAPSVALRPERGELHLLATWDGVRTTQAVQLTRDEGSIGAVVLTIPQSGSTILSTALGGEIVIFQDDGQVFYAPFDSPEDPAWSVSEAGELGSIALSAVAVEEGWAVVAPPATIAVVQFDEASESPLVLGGTLHDIAWSPTVGDLVVAAGADGVMPMAIVDDRLERGVAVDVGRDVRRVTVDDDLAVAMDDLGRLFLLHRDGVAGWSIVDNLAFDAGVTDQYVDIRLRDDRLLISAGDRGIRVIPVVRETEPDRWLFGDEVTVLLLDDAESGVQSVAFTDADLLDGHVIALGDGSIWGFDLGSAVSEAMPLILRRRDGVPIETRFAAMAVSAPGKLLVLDPSLGLVGFQFDPLAEEPFDIRTGFYVNAVEQLSNEIARGEPVSLASEGEWVSRLSRELGFQLVWNGVATRFTPVVTYDDGFGSDQPGFVSTPCPALRHVFAGSHIVVVHDCGVDLRRLEHRAGE